MFHFKYSLLVNPLLLKFMLLITLLQGPGFCWSKQGVKHSHIKVGLLKPTIPDSPLADTSNLAPSSWSGVTGCKSGSVHISLHTSVSREAVISRISLCLTDEKPPFLQDSACSTSKLLPHSHLEGR